MAKEDYIIAMSDVDPLLRAIDMADMAREYVRDLGALFEAIKDASDEHSNARTLAGIGRYLATDWCDVIETEQESLAAQRKKRDANPA